MVLNFGRKVEGKEMNIFALMEGEGQRSGSKVNDLGLNC